MSLQDQASVLVISSALNRLRVQGQIYNGCRQSRTMVSEVTGRLSSQAPNGSAIRILKEFQNPLTKRTQAFQRVIFPLF